MVQTSAKEQERSLFDQSILMLEQARDEGGYSYKGIEAVNLRPDLWMIVIEDLGSPANGLPSELRASLISIGIFIFRELEAIRQETLADYDSIIDITKIHPRWALIMKISLRAGEKIYVNGAVLRADRKVSTRIHERRQFSSRKPRHSGGSDDDAPSAALFRCTDHADQSCNEGGGQPHIQAYAERHSWQRSKIRRC